MKSFVFEQNFGHSMRRKLLALSALLFSVLVFFGAPGIATGETLIDRIVAVVNGAPILSSRIAEKVQHGPIVVVSEFPATEQATEVEKATQDAINFELIMQKAKELEIDVRDDEVDAEIKRFLESRDLTKDGLIGFLKQQGKSFEDYKRDFRDQMILRRFQGRVMSPLVKVTDKDVETWFLKKTGGTSDVVELTLRQILVRVAPDSSPEIVAAKRALIDDVHKKLQAGMPFEEAVKVYSDDTAARATGGLLEGIRLKDLSGSIRAEVEGLEQGKFTTPIQTGAGFYIFSLEGRKFSGSREFLSQKENLEFELRSMELATQTQRWLAEERQKTKIELIAN